ncbi:MAG: molybdenum cofactor biosynthesis protein MoaE [Cytophagales bacterium]|nr:molybdenum cofactor biosynthesis protein MoaE [Cytophagales bacterium]
MNPKKKTAFVWGAITPTCIAKAIAKYRNGKDLGMHAIFLGQVNADAKSKYTMTGIEYSAHEETAEEAISCIRKEAQEQFELNGIHIRHSLGFVKTGEVGLFVFTSSNRRETAMNACDFLVENIRKRVPVFGKKHLKHKTNIWKEN